MLFKSATSLKHGEVNKVLDLPDTRDKRHSKEVTAMKRMVVLCIMALSLLMAVNASAVPISTDAFDLGVPNSGISAYPGPYASVTIDLNTATTATITFQALTTGGYDYYFGSAQMADVNVNAADFSSDVTFAADKNADGFGKFNFTYDGPDGAGNWLTTFSFDLTNLSGTWADAADVLTPNASGWTAAAHIFVLTAGAPQTDGAIVTGFAANGAPPQVPEPGTILLLGSGLLALAIYRRKRVEG